MTDAVYLSGADLEGLATIGEFVDVVREGFRYRGDGAPSAAPSRLAGRAASLTTYTAIFPEWGVMGGYMYAVGNDVWYTTPLFDSETGELLAVLDGAQWNPQKTGSVAAVGTEALAREDASSIGIVGSSNIAWDSLSAIDVVRDVETASVFSPTPANRREFADAARSGFGIEVEPVASSTEAVAGADVVVTATNASEPVIDGDDLDPGTHVTAMGAAHPQREIDVRTFERLDRYVPDIRDRAFGNSIQQRARASRAFLAAFDANVVSETSIHGGLGQVVAGTVPGRTDDEEITLVDSIGTGIETVAAAKMLYEKAVDAGLGTAIRNEPKRTRYAK